MEEDCKKSNFVPVDPIQYTRPLIVHLFG
ncbi:hypothetical protein JL09_g6790 [Pichia kudriavzevii]|uniref:Uncharacterized protein n=1 Tax=Pichia kudriavzevii TaxID=4909 RepID=A0A099NKX7_PICKU|nr:hypothetical protein JL09_g6792 [Pichia kudriavzevii]KGK32603.1 hypothetical protein JL09_g6790 [Pichia kudriavzevii]